MTKHIAVLKGGWSAEREVSLVSGAACAKALRERGYRVDEIDVGRDVAEKLSALKPDIAFNALHGRFGEDGCMQGLLEILHIPYTHSGVLASALAMDKPMAKRMFEAAGLRCPHGIPVRREEFGKGDPLPRPYVIKPANEGSSVGVHMVTREDNRPLALIAAEAADHPYLAEAYIPGRELTVAVLNGRPLGVTELRPAQGFYDYANKYTDGRTLHLCPAPIHGRAYDEAMAAALAAHRALGCRGLTRADFRYDDTQGEPGVLYLLEINTQPGMTPLSLSPEQAAHAGIDFHTLVDMLVKAAELG
ncbi:MAG: D-alanine--D-alanine ligase [Alphaproteobacteria bacterium]|nr:D-alanine--D-alanine ligase [Alphaproteobacteria bacterium]